MGLIVAIDRLPTLCRDDGRCQYAAAQRLAGVSA